MDLYQKKIHVIGLGMTGLATAKFLHHRGAIVTATDMASEKNMSPAATELRRLGIETVMGNPYAEGCDTADMIVLSPGVPHTSDFLMRARSNGVCVIGEIELASRFVTVPIIAITGTNGKTTVTSLIGSMLKSCGLNVFVGGNIGDPLIGHVDRDENADWIVLEVSSFQLDTISTFRPDIGILLNITEDHLDRYPSMSAYAASKLRIFQNQTDRDIAIINGSDPWIRRFSDQIPGCRWVFGDPVPEQRGSAEIADGTLRIKTENCFSRNVSPKPDHPADHRADGIFRIDISRSRLFGRHNHDNISAAVMAALAAGGSVQGIQMALNNFKGLPHRIEFVRTLHGVTYVDDSKATNIGAVYRALECFEQPVVLIMGGIDKGGDYRILEPVIQNRVKRLIVMGEAADIITTALGNIVPTRQAASMADAVAMAFQMSKSGDVVLLSPACSSFDMFKSYAHRGIVYQDEVNHLQ